MLDPFDAEEFRRYAARCAARAAYAAWDRHEQERLKRAHAALLALADTADWLAGRSHVAAFQSAAENRP